MVFPHQASRAQSTGALRLLLKTKYFGCHVRCPELLANFPPFWGGWAVELAWLPGEKPETITGCRLGGGGGWGVQAFFEK